MKDSPKRWMPTIAAALLASITFRVFFQLQDYGPESAIRGFNETIKALSFEKLNATQVPSSEKFMIETLKRWFESGVTMQVERVKRTGDQVRAVVSFSFPNGSKWSSVWVVQRGSKGWEVDMNKTATIFGDSRPPRSPL